MSASFVISEEDLAEIEKAVRYIREGKYADAFSQIDRIERITKRIRGERRKTEEALNEITVAVKGFQSALIVGELNVSGTLNM
jgi:hypothetical protein